MWNRTQRLGGSGYGLRDRLGLVEPGAAAGSIGPIAAAIFNVDDVGVMHEPVDQGRGQLLVTEHTFRIAPLTAPTKNRPS